MIYFAGKGKMTSGSMIFTLMMNQTLQVWIDCEPGTKNCCYSWMQLISSLIGFDCVLMACEDRIVGVRDLRLKLQKKSLQQVSQSGKGHLSGMRDLREKLSGTMNSQPVNSDPPKPKLEAAKLARKSVAVEAPEPESKRVAVPASKKKDQQKA